jgi:hypothetical protein
LSDGEKVQAAVDLEPIPPVPITTVLNQLVSSGQVFGKEVVVAKEEADADKS